MKPQILIYALTGLVLGSLTIGLVPIRKLNAQNFNLAKPLPNSFAQVTPAPKGQMGMHHDRHFIEKMIPHHETAVEMADLALVQAKHPELKQLAAAIKSTQSQEIQEMRRWYRQWYGAEVPKVDMGGMGMGGMTMRDESRGNRTMHSCMMKGMGMPSDLTALKQSTDFDREFIRQMIPHHQMAVMMSSMILTSEHPELRSLAQSIIQSQTSEIRQMQQWYQSWYS